MGLSTAESTSTNLPFVVSTNRQSSKVATWSAQIEFIEDPDTTKSTCVRTRKELKPNSRWEHTLLGSISRPHMHYSTLPYRFPSVACSFHECRCTNPGAALRAQGPLQSNIYILFPLS